MNCGFTTARNSILIHNDTIEIHHNRLIQTTADYDFALVAALKYTNDEGFLSVNDEGEKEEHHIEYIHLIDSTGKQIVREECL